MVRGTRLRQRLTERVAYSPVLSRLAFRALRSRALGAFPPYRFLLARQIRAVKARNASFPRVVAAENTNACNARCAMCPYPAMARPKGVMAMPLYRKIVDECALHPGVELRLSGFGEPLLDADLFARIRYAKEKGIEIVQLTTNASLLDGEKARGLVDSGIDEVMLSVDGWDRESYARIRVGLDFDRVRENARGLLCMRGEGRKPRVVASIILFDEYASRRGDIIAAWRDCADRFFVKPPEDWAGQVRRPGGAALPRRPHIPCPYLWTQFLIAWDGTVGLCCRDFCDIRTPIGSVADRGIAEVWHGETLARIREGDARGRTQEVCRGCLYAPNWWGERS
ncbi:MAG: radical SAM protein [Chlamydiota bacterium]